jgi:hypothetical protein
MIDDVSVRAFTSTQENFVRVGLFRYNLLGKMDKCHVIDVYTFLSSGGRNEFLKTLREHSKLVSDLGGNLIRDLELEPSIYEKAADYCQRVGNKVLVPGCKACNLVMARDVTHSDAVFRCYPQSAGLNVPELEDNSRQLKKGNAMKRLLQQIALYFKLDSSSGYWSAREEGEVMPLLSLWRCVANLCMWGKGGLARYRLVAVFYAGVMLYERLRMKDTMLLVDWHMHVFRVFYMQEVPACTFFGMQHAQVAVTFDTTRKSGLVWCELLEQHMQWAHDKLETFMRTSVNMRQVARFKDAVSLYVTTEKSLFHYLCKRAGVRGGVEAIMSFYMYNFKDPRAKMLQTRGQLFIKDMIREVGRDMQGSATAVTDGMGALSLTSTTARSKGKKKTVVEDEVEDP